MKISQKPREEKTLIKCVLNSTFSHNIASTRHGRRSALKLHSFVGGVLRQVSIGFSPPGSGHMPRYEPPCPKISSHDTFCTIWSYGHHKHPIPHVAASCVQHSFVRQGARQKVSDTYHHCTFVCRGKGAVVCNLMQMRKTKLINSVFFEKLVLDSIFSHNTINTRHVPPRRP